MVVRRSVGLKRALILPRGPVGPSTTNRPSSIGRPLSFAICSKVSNALSSLPLAVWYRADSGSQGVMHANMNRGADERPKSHLHPKVGATANARATSKHAPSAQKH